MYTKFKKKCLCMNSKKYIRPPVIWDHFFAATGVVIKAGLTVLLPCPKTKKKHTHTTVTLSSPLEEFFCSIGKAKQRDRTWCDIPWKPRPQWIKRTVNSVQTGLEEKRLDPQKNTTLLHWKLQFPGNPHPRRCSTLKAASTWALPPVCEAWGWCGCTG